MNSQPPLIRVTDSLDLVSPPSPQKNPNSFSDQSDEMPADLINDLAPPQDPNAPIGAIGLDQIQPAPLEFQLTDERKKLLNSFSLYRYSRFYQRIVEVYPQIFDDLSKRPDEELIKDLELIKSFIQHRRASDQVLQVFKNSLIAIDVIAEMLKMEVKGASDQLIKDDDVLDTLEEVRLKYELNMSLEPEHRLGISVISVYLKVNSLNQQKKKLEQDQVRKVIQDKLMEPDLQLEIEFRDL
jgi:hypothetical protein